MKRSVIIGSVVAAVVVVATGLGVLIWWLVRENRYQTLTLEGDGFNNVNHRAAFTRIPSNGDMLWLFYPTTAEDPTSRPIVLWLDGVVGLPPSLLANFGMFGPLDLNLDSRTDSWVNEYNLLFVDAPLGTGFSSSDTDVPRNLDDNAYHIFLTLLSFYSQNAAYTATPLYIFGQGYGAQMALTLAQEIHNNNEINSLRGVVLGNPIISPALALTKLGFYLEELGYIDFNGREAIENLSDETTRLINEGRLEEAFDTFVGLNEFINENAGTVAVNLDYIVEKLSNTSRTDIFGARKYLRQISGFNSDFNSFMEETVGQALGITNPQFQSRSEEVIQSFREIFMTPAVDKVEYLLSNTDLSVTIYNGNLDAVSNTPGQLEWVNTLQWPGQDEFLSSPRRTLSINRLIEGYFRETDRLTFYWINVAGLMAPIDNAVAIRSILRRIMDE